MKPKRQHLSHLTPNPWEAQEAQSEWLLEQFDQQLREVKPSFAWDVPWYARGEQCPQPTIEGHHLEGWQYEIPTCSETGRTSVYRRPMMGLYEDTPEGGEDGGYDWLEFSTPARWPRPFNQDDLLFQVTLERDMHPNRHLFQLPMSVWVGDA